jgi:hypothetical protein
VTCEACGQAYRLRSLGDNRYVRELCACEARDPCGPKGPRKARAHRCTRAVTVALTSSDPKDVEGYACEVHNPERAEEPEPEPVSVPIPAKAVEKVEYSDTLKLVLQDLNQQTHTVRCLECDHVHKYRDRVPVGAEPNWWIACPKCQKLSYCMEER